VQIHQKQEEQEKAERHYRMRQQLLLGKGVTREHIELLPRNDRIPVPLPIVQDMETFHQALLKKNQEKEKETIKLAFGKKWLEKTEREMHSCQVKALSTSSIPPRARASIISYRDILSNKLKMFFRHFHMVDKEEPLKERRRKCIEWGLLTASNQHMVKSVYEPLPVVQGVDDAHATTDSDDDDFATPEGAKTASQSILPPQTTSPEEEQSRKRKASSQNPEDNSD